MTLCANPKGFGLRAFGKGAFLIGTYMYFLLEQKGLCSCDWVDSGPVSRKIRTTTLAAILYRTWE